MSVDLAAIRARLASLEGFTAGPWRIAYTFGQGGIDSYKVYTDAVEGYPVAIGEVNPYRYVPADQALFAAGPDLHRDLTAAVDEIERLRRLIAEAESALSAAGIAEATIGPMVMRADAPLPEATVLTLAKRIERLATAARETERADVLAFIAARQACRAAERDEARGDGMRQRRGGAAAELSDLREEIEAGNHVGAAEVSDV